MIEKKKFLFAVPSKLAVMRVDTNLRLRMNSNKLKSIIRRAVRAQDNMLGKTVISSCLILFKTGPDKAVTVSDHAASKRRLEHIT